MFEIGFRLAKGGFGVRMKTGFSLVALDFPFFVLQALFNPFSFTLIVLGLGMFYDDRSHMPIHPSKFRYIMWNREFALAGDKKHECINCDREFTGKVCWVMYSSNIVNPTGQLGRLIFIPFHNQACRDEWKAKYANGPFEEQYELAANMEGLVRKEPEKKNE